MNCREFGDSLCAYLEAQLPPERRELVDAHRAACASCAEVFRVAHELTCRELVEFLDDYVVDRLPSDRRAVFERHIAICENCDAYLDGYRETLRLGRDAARQSAEEEVAAMPEKLVAAILAARRRPPETR